MNMDWRALLSPYQGRLFHSLRSCIRIPSVYADDGSGHPYGQPVHDCLQYMLKLSSDMGFATGSCDTATWAGVNTVRAKKWWLYWAIWMWSPPARAGLWTPLAAI